MSKFTKGQLIVKIARGFIPGVPTIWETAIVLETDAEDPDLQSADEETLLVRIFMDGETKYDNELFYSSVEEALKYEKMI